jgi:hypothetical protein
MEECRGNRINAAAKIFCYCKATELIPDLSDYFGKIKLS